MLFTTHFLHHIRNCYDIRSTKLTENDAFDIGASFGTEVQNQGGKVIVICHDRRLHSKALCMQCAKGIVSTGINVINIGQMPTAAGQLAEIDFKADATIVVTASHNFPEFHGFKLFHKNQPFAGIHLENLVNRILKKDYTTGSGKIKNINFGPRYYELLEKNLKIKGEFKIAWDFLNGTAADIFPYIKKLFKGTHYILNHKLDPHFSGFSPDPTYEPRLTELKQLIKTKNLDFGVAFDGDCDRCVVIDKNLNLIPGDRLLALFAFCESSIKKKIIKVVWDAKSSNLLINWAKPFCVSNVSITGYPNIYNLLVKTQSDIAGECSGHYVFSDFHNINDGMYSALKLVMMLEQMSKIIGKKFDLTTALKELPTSWVLAANHIPCKHDEKEEMIQKIVKIAQKKSLTFDLNDGIKIHYLNGWCLIRPSNTEEILRISAEGWTKEGLEEIKNAIDAIISEIL